jgi:tRNA U34 5-methylaminomethyl-2-thiouridine-forming methyltransferase MnmC
MQTKLVETKNGDFTLYVPALDEHYHSTNGAIEEALHVYIVHGIKNNCKKPECNILEIGFGTGLNAYLSAIYANENNQKINYFSLDKYPLEKTVYEQLNYARFFHNEDDVWSLITESEWNKDITVSKNFSLYKATLDLLQWTPPLNTYDIIFFDAFGPDKQPEMWSAEIMKNMANALVSGGVWCSYTSKGTVKQALRVAGLTVKRLPGPQGKRHILNAIKEDKKLISFLSS